MALFRLGCQQSRSRQWRRFARLWKRRCFLWMFWLSLLCLVYVSFFSVKFSFHGSHYGQFNQGTLAIAIGKRNWRYSHDRLSGNINISFKSEDSYVVGENEGSTDIEVLPNSGLLSSNGNNDLHARTRGGLLFSRPRAKSRKRHFPCEVDFVESVNNLVEPRDYMNFTQFSLAYINKEELPLTNDVSEPLFGGHQTLEERENSYYARNQTLHCGFVKGPERYPSTGFDLNEKDKEHMASCSVVVSSCIFGSSDFLRRPTRSKIGSYSKENVCFMMFLDELTLTKLSSEGHVPDDYGYIGLWRIVVVKNLPYTDMRKTGKVPKFLSHRLFPSARYSIWIDSKMRLNVDPMLILEYFLWRKRSEYAISKHYDRHCVWEEVIQNKRLNKYNHTAIDEQFQFYQSDGLVKHNETDMNAPLPSYVPEGSFIVRAHTPMSNLFSCLWFNEVNRYTSRDQLSFAYTFLKLSRMNPGKPFLLSMFKDCERRAIAKLFHHRTENPQPPPAGP